MNKQSPRIRRLRPTLPVARIVAPVLLSALTACSLAPDYQRPDLPVPQNWPAAASSRNDALPGEKATTLSWRQYFTDARLQQLIDIALANNRDLAVAAANLEAARAQYGYAQAQRLPNIGVGVSRSETWTPQSLAHGQGADAIRYDANIGLSAFEIDFWLRLRDTATAARSQFLASESSRRFLQLGVISNTAQSWFALLEMNERVQLARTTLETREASERLAVRQRDVGTGDAISALQAAALTQSARVDLASLERSRAAAEDALQLLLGQPLPDALRNALPQTRLQDVRLAPLAADLPSEILLARPDIVAAEHQLIAANANIGVARAAFLPKISLTGTFGTASPALSGLFDTGSRAWNFTPAINIPILYALFAGPSYTRIAEAQKKAAVATYEQTIQKAFSDVADLLAARSSLTDQVRAQAALAQHQTDRLNLVRQRFNLGSTSRLELLDAQRDAYAAQQLLLQTRSAQLANAAQLYKALGGGLGSEVTTDSAAISE